MLPNDNHSQSQFSSLSVVSSAYNTTKVHPYDIDDQRSYCASASNILQSLPLFCPMKNPTRMSSHSARRAPNNCVPNFFLEVASNLVTNRIYIAFTSATHNEARPLFYASLRQPHTRALCSFIWHALVALRRTSDTTRPITNYCCRSTHSFSGKASEPHAAAPTLTSARMRNNDNHRRIPRQLQLLSNNNPPTNSCLN